MPDNPIHEQPVPAFRDARDQMIHACALQEHIIAYAPILPSSVRVNERISLARGYKHIRGEDEADVEVTIPGGPDGVLALRAELGGALEQQSQVADDGRRELVTRLRGSKFGCSFVVSNYCAEAAVKAVA